MLLCTCLALNPHVTRYAQLKSIPLSCRYVIIQYFSLSSMSTLHCDHRMKLPCDAVTVDYLAIFMQLDIYRICTHKLLQPSTCIFM